MHQIPWDWRKVAKKLQSLGPQFDVCPSSNSKAQQETYAEGEEYHALRKPANQQWESVRSCYQKVATTYSKGARQHAAYLSDQVVLTEKWVEMHKNKGVGFYSIHPGWAETPRVNKSLPDFSKSYITRSLHTICIPFIFLAFPLLNAYNFYL